uniref:Col_cuticle_N domain-containing protein n=1 Tax=Elaeophora elaphi TaxID=1147741 RepID=A0A0R3RU78_9BILA
MYSVLSAMVIASPYLGVIATVIAISVIIDCTKKKELIVEATQPSLGENSKISVFNREGETDIEMPSHLQNLKEPGGSRKSEIKELNEMKKDRGKDEKKEAKSNPNSKRSEKRSSTKEASSAKNDNQGGEAEVKGQKSTEQKQLQSFDVERSNHENQEKSTEKRKSWKFQEHQSGSTFS